jgi:hypothetical protein
MALSKPIVQFDVREGLASAGSVIPYAKRQGVILLA